MSQQATSRKLDVSRTKRRLRRAIRTRAAHELEPLRVLLVQHDVRLRRLLGAVLRDDGYQVTTAVNADELHARLDAIVFGLDPPGREPELIIVDARLPGKTHDDVMEMLQRVRDEVPVIVIGRSFDIYDLDELRAAVLTGRARGHC